MELSNQIKFLQVECLKNQQTLEELKTQFGLKTVHLFEESLLKNTKILQRIIQSLEDLKKIRAEV